MPRSTSALRPIAAFGVVCAMYARPVQRLVGIVEFWMNVGWHCCVVYERNVHRAKKCQRAGQPSVVKVSIVPEFLYAAYVAIIELEQEEEEV